MQGIGYKEIYASLDGEYDLDRARYIIKRDTRHFAKRQITWFKREKDVTWMNYPDYNNSQAEMLDAMLKMIKERGIIKRWIQQKKCISGRWELMKKYMTTVRHCLKI